MKRVVAPTAWSISLIPRVNARKIPNSSPPFPNLFSPKPYSFFSSPLVRPLSMAASAAQVYHSLNLYELLGFCIHASSSKLMRFFFLFSCLHVFVFVWIYSDCVTRGCHHWCRSLSTDQRSSGCLFPHFFCDETLKLALFWLLKCFWDDIINFSEASKTLT